jgi:hypothetical protein
MVLADHSMWPPTAATTLQRMTLDFTSDKLHKDRTASNAALLKLKQRTSVIGQENWPMWGIYDGHEYVDRNPLSAFTGNLTLFL